MPRLRKSVILLCVIIFMAGEIQKLGLSTNQDTSYSLNKKNIAKVEPWEKTMAAYDKAILNFIGTSPLEEIKIEKDENFVRLRRTLAYGQSQIVIEVTDNNVTSPVIKFSKIQLNPYCHPMFSLPYNDPVCFKLIYSHQKTISPIEVDVLMNTLAEKEFWELSPNESPIRGSQSFIYDGEHWSIEARSTYYDWSMDSTKDISHSVFRHQIHSLESFREIGNHILRMAEDKYVFP